MLQSMTGFGSQTFILQMKGGEESSVVVEIKSLNSRFFETTCKLPSSLNFLEIPITSLLKQNMVRGRVFVSIRLGGNGVAFDSVVPVFKVAKDYFTAAKMIQKRLKLSGSLTINDLISMPNVFSFEREEVGKEVEAKILQVVGKVIDKLVLTRKAEGMRLQKDLEKRLSSCNSHMDKIKQLFDAFMKKQKVTIKKLLTLSKKGDQGAERTLSDQYDLINKIDVHEEIVRFNSHLKGAKKLLSTRALEKGKRFEFIVQELAREINTIAAKCSHVDISALAVDVKVELEKVREQVQNIV